MMDLFDNKKEWTVSEVSFAIKQLVEGAFEHVRIKGEIFGAP